MSRTPEETRIALAAIAAIRRILDRPKPPPPPDPLSTKAMLELLRAV